MIRKDRLALCAMALAMAIPAPVNAQDAAETAVILSGTGAGQAKAARSLNSAVSQSVNSAAGVVRSSTPTHRRSTTHRRSRRNAPSVASVIATGDALEGTDASAYQVGSGATIKVSGSFRPSAAARCTDNCEGTAGADPKQ